jgi:hypothetical protein
VIIKTFHWGGGINQCHVLEKIYEQGDVNNGGNAKEKGRKCRDKKETLKRQMEIKRGK